MKKGKRQINIKINLTNRWLYTLIAIGILAIVGVGVYAYGTSNPTVFGHSAAEMDFTGIAANSIPVSAVNFASGQISAPINIKGNFSGNVNSSYVARGGSAGFGSLGKGLLYLGKGGSKIFYVYKPISVLFHVIGTPGTATLEMGELSSSTSWSVVKSLTSTTAYDFTGGDYQKEVVILFPGNYRLTVTNTPDAGAWLFLNSVYGQDNNNPYTAWNIQ